MNIRNLLLFTVTLLLICIAMSSYAEDKPQNSETYVDILKNQIIRINNDNSELVFQRNEFQDKYNNELLKNQSLQKEVEEFQKKDFFKVGGYGMIMGCIVLIVSLIAIIIATYLIKIDKNARDVISTFGLILILSFAVFILIAGYDATQIAPVYGLMGTAMGYIFGKNQSKDKSE